MTASPQPSPPSGSDTRAVEYRLTIAAAPQARIELVEIVTRAHRLSFDHWRVATALGASHDELALIDIGIAAQPGRQHHQELLDVSRPTSGPHGLRTASPR